MSLIFTLQAGYIIAVFGLKLHVLASWLVADQFGRCPPILHFRQFEGFRYAEDLMLLEEQVVRLAFCLILVELNKALASMLVFMCLVIDVDHNLRRFVLFVVDD